VYPDYDWEAQGAPKKPSGYWNDIENQREFFDELAEKLNIQKPEDWYSVRVDTVRQHGGSFLVNQYNNSLIRGKVIVY
jgi:hypothetical protein